MKPLGEILDEAPPAAIEAERGLLCAALLDPRVIDATDVKPRDFHDHRHVAIWQAMKAGARDIPLLRQRLGAEWEGAYIGELATAGGLPIHATSYAAEIRNAAAKRRLRELCIEGLP